ncbi:MAG: MotA/TolQ/ExbB proton channel family protein [Bacteroidetes bacterium]|nr:MotA/TolQ/ExbB proton channel family protein [Bacteroidota bacterium]
MLLSVLLQATGAPGPKEEVNLSILDLLMKGGFVMYPIFLLLFLALYLFFERYAVISRAGKVERSLLVSVTQHLQAGNVNAAQAMLAASPTMVARIYEKGVNRLGSPISEIQSGMESQAKVAVATMEKNLSILSAVAALAPMFGFLGTIFGMIVVFSKLSIADNLDIGDISDGIYVKMVTSAAGLIVGIIAHILYIWLSARIDRALLRLEVAANEFLDFLYKPS